MIHLLPSDLTIRSQQQVPSLLLALLKEPKNLPEADHVFSEEPLLQHGRLSAWDKSAILGLQKPHSSDENPRLLKPRF